MEEMIRKAIEARDKAYAPYSHFKVGACLRAKNGQTFQGCNIENSSYPATNCAERTAIFNGVSKGNRKLKALALIGSTKEFTYPCGMCRQVMLEFAENDDMIIYIAKSEKEVIEIKMKDLLPGSFSKKDLGF